MDSEFSSQHQTAGLQSPAPKTEESQSKLPFGRRSPPILLLSYHFPHPSTNSFPSHSDAFQPPRRAQPTLTTNDSTLIILRQLRGQRPKNGPRHAKPGFQRQRRGAKAAPHRRSNRLGQAGLSRLNLPLKRHECLAIGSSHRCYPFHPLPQSLLREASEAVQNFRRLLSR